MPRSSPVDGFSLAYDRTGDGPPVVLLHGWPGGRTDYRASCPCWPTSPTSSCRTCGGSGSPTGTPSPPTRAYTAAAQARSVTGLLDELGLGPVVLAGYDIGSRIAQTVASQSPERVRALVVTPPMPGAGQRLLDPDVAHASSGTRTSTGWTSPPGCSTATGTPSARTSSTSGRTGRALVHAGGRGPRPARRDLRAAGCVHRLDRLVPAGTGDPRPRPGRAAPGTGGPAPRAHAVLWPAHDPLFPSAWGDRLDEFFADVAVTPLPDSGHFVPLEAPDAFASAIRAALGGKLISPAVRGELLPAAGRRHHRRHRPVVHLAREFVDPLVVEHDGDEHGVGAGVDQRTVVVAATAAQPDPEAVDRQRRDDDGVGGPDRGGAQPRADGMGQPEPAGFQLAGVDRPVQDPALGRDDRQQDAGPELGVGLGQPAAPGFVGVGDERGQRADAPQPVEQGRGDRVGGRGALARRTGPPAGQQTCAQLVLATAGSPGSVTPAA